MSRFRVPSSAAWRIAAALLFILSLSGCVKPLQTENGSAARSTPPFPPLLMTTTPLVNPPASEVPAEGPTTSDQPPVENTPVPPVVDAPTIEPTPEPVVVEVQPSPLPTVEPIIAPTQAAVSYEQRWRAQELNRTVFDPRQRYSTAGRELWWYDPLNQQHIILGTISGTFEAQAYFTLLGQGVEAVEVPYQVNTSYGLTSLSPAIVQRIHDAGYGEWIETYVIIGGDVRADP